MKPNRLYLLPLIIGLIGCCIIACPDKVDASSAHDPNLPNGFEEFNEYRYFVHYDDSINGYDVKVMILPTYQTWKQSCRAIISLKNDSTNLKIVHDGWLDTLSYEKGTGTLVIPRDTVIKWHYNKPTISKNEHIAMEVFANVPFFFYDIDFDGEDDLLLNLYGQGSRWANAYEVVELCPDRLLSIFRKPPFTDLDDLTRIDPVNKTITLVDYMGMGEEWETVYMISQEEHSTTVTEKYSDDIWYWGRAGSNGPVYRRVYPISKSDTTEWRPYKPETEHPASAQ